MIIVLKQHAPADKVEAFCKELNGMGYQINDSDGSDTHILGLIGVACQKDDHNKCSFSSRTKFVFVGARGSPAAKTA